MANTDFLREFLEKHKRELLLVNYGRGKRGEYFYGRCFDIIGDYALFENDRTEKLACVEISSIYALRLLLEKKQNKSKYARR